MNVCDSGNSCKAVSRNQYEKAEGTQLFKPFWDVMASTVRRELSDYRFAFVDLTSDGLVDIVVAKTTGTLQFYLNVGTGTAPVFEEQCSGRGTRWGSPDTYSLAWDEACPTENKPSLENNPFRESNIGEANDRGMPTFVDLDFDGLLDMASQHRRRAGLHLRPRRSRTTQCHHAARVASPPAPLLLLHTGGRKARYT